MTALRMPPLVGHPRDVSIEPQTYLAWGDDGIFVMCERPECMVPSPLNGMLTAIGELEPGESMKVWWTSDLLPYRLSAEQAAEAIQTHVRTHEN